MVKRKSWRAYAFLTFALLVMMACWESNKTSAAVVDPVIPQDAIRLRILANSDSVQDQQTKRIVRDAIVDQMNTWVTGPHTIEEARQVVNSHLPELNDLVGGMLTQYGYHYGFQVELGIVPFPTKMYGDQVYPAGNYEALRVTLGKGEGQNWWCVLFPPLCFVDAAAGEAVAKEKQLENDARKQQAAETKQTEAERAKAAAASLKPDAGNAGTVSAKPGSSDQAASVEPPQKAALQIESNKQVKFFLWEKARSLFSWVKKLFA